MDSLDIVQVMSILFWIFATRMRIWKTDLNTYALFTVLFLITVSAQFDLLQCIWIDYHLYLTMILMIFLFIRVVYKNYVRGVR
jgi:hypothetical protein